MRLLVLAIALLFITSAFSIELVQDMTVKKIQEGEYIGEDKGEDLFTSENVLSVKQSFLMSLVLPGLGEFYSKSYIKAAGFLAAEIGLWAGFAYYMNEYNIKEDDFKDYANSHWIDSVWLGWYDSLCALKDTNQLGIEILPDTKTQQYYEMIGKYDWFVFGWDDIISRDDFDDLVMQTFELAAPLPPEEVHRVLVRDILSKLESPHRDHYTKMRKDANKQYSSAKYFLGVVVVNHLISAFDAAITAKRSNDKLYKGFTGVKEIDLNARCDIIHGLPTPKLTMTLVW